MLEKIIPSILAALLPFLVNYFSKKNKASIRKNMIDDAQKKIDFLDRYYEVSNKLLPEAQILSLKVQLSNELFEVKNKISSFDKEESISDYQKLNSIQKLFLTFKPASVLGWIWATLFYLNLAFISFAVLGLLLDVEGNFSSEAFAKNLQDTDTLIGIGAFIVSLLFFRWLAIRNYKSKSYKGYKHETPTE